MPNGLPPDIMNGVLIISKHRPKTNRYGQSSIPYRADQIRNLLPCETKDLANLDSFKSKIK